jgi:hypothetical protein
MASVIKRIIKLLSVLLVFSLLVPSVSEANGRKQTYTVDPRTYLVDNPSDVDDLGWICNDCVYRITGVKDGDSFVFIVPFASSRILYYGRQEVGYSAELVNIEEVPVDVSIPEDTFWAPAIAREWNLPIGSYAKLIVTLSNDSFIGDSRGYDFENARLGITDSAGANWILFQFTNEGVWQGQIDSSVRDFYASFKIQRFEDECLRNLYLSLAEKKAQDLGNYEKCRVEGVNPENLNHINESLISQLPKYEDLRVEISKISGIYAKRIDFLRAFNSSVKARRSLTPSLYSEIGIKGLDGKNKGWIINRINESAPFPSSLDTIQDLVLKFAQQNLEIQGKRNAIKLELKGN